MSDRSPVTEESSATGLFIAALIVVIAIVLLIILARGPEDQERSGTFIPVAAIVTSTA